jgi:hypothetical protein
MGKRTNRFFITDGSAGNFVPLHPELFSRCENKLRESWLLQKLVQQGAFGWLLGF